MADSDCGDARTKVQETAGELYQIAALMMGDESQAAELVETAVAKTEIDPCAERDATVLATCQTLVESAVARLSKADPKAFEIPPPMEESSGHCIDDDDLSATGISASQLAGMVRGPERSRLREWLNKLPVAQRAIFVERAILGWDNAAAAASLRRAASRNWQPRQVSELFRQALCSLATSLVHAVTAQV
ncbi:MAG TPA: hypothetical protein VME86_18315 [Acidobacteriaceae bacterium]|nr:hypothetical protein [Acidobacteriaceae bacterium]